MYQVAAPILNRIAQTVPMQTSWGRALFSMTQEALTAELAAQGEALELAGVADRVALAYQEVGPLLAEHQAISRFIATTENSALRASLPEVTTVAEAVTLATQEFDLTPEEASGLAGLLSRMPLT